MVVPLYNKRAYIGAALDSLAGQLLPGDELIIVNDASTDGSDTRARATLETAAWRRPAIRTRMVELPRNAGPGAARNAGLELARGDVVAFLDADDRYEPDALARIRAAFIEHDFGMLVLGFRSDPEGECFPEAGSSRADGERLGGGVVKLCDPLRSVCDPDFMLGRASNVVARRALIGPERYCTRARLNEGVDFWYRVLRRVVAQQGAGGVGLIETPVIRFRLLADSLSHRRPRHWRDLDVPPIVRRYFEQPGQIDHAIAVMVANRWLDFAAQAFSRTEAWPDFVASHRAWLQQLGVSVPEPSREQTA